jgi:hypothetical protein
VTRDEGNAADDVLMVNQGHFRPCFWGDPGYNLFFHIGAWRSLVAHLLWEQGVGGSNPLAPTNKVKSAMI